jgi:hypothetical protein
MITNSSLTIYHKDGLDVSTHLEKWTRYNYDKVWYFGGKGASINKGYDNANDVEIRIPYGNLDITKFALGDIIVKGTLDFDIDTQKDLKNYEIYNITSIKNNTFGNNPHIHIGGK